MPLPFFSTNLLCIFEVDRLIAWFMETTSHDNQVTEYRSFRSLCADGRPSFAKTRRWWRER